MIFHLSGIFLIKIVIKSFVTQIIIVENLVVSNGNSNTNGLLCLLMSMIYVCCWFTAETTQVAITIILCKLPFSPIFSTRSLSIVPHIRLLVVYSCICANTKFIDTMFSYSE